MTPAMDGSILDPARWGLPDDALGDELVVCHARYRRCFRTRTRDGSKHALNYLKGIISMAKDRNYANIARTICGEDDDGQALQHFMSGSSWSARAVFTQIHEDIRARPELHGGTLLLDESADERDGEHSAGAAKQHNGRLGKVETSQVGVGLGYKCGDSWFLVDAELFVPECWFTPAFKTKRRAVEMPEERTFATKPELGVDMVSRSLANGLPFAAVVADSLYGRSQVFRRKIAELGVTYVVDVPVDTHIHLERPMVEVSESGTLRIDGQTLEVRELAAAGGLAWCALEVRPTERGMLRLDFAAQPVWTVMADGTVRAEMLLARREANGTVGFSLSNAAAETSLEQLARWRCDRYFVERVFQDAKSQIGWDELVARKYRAWEHHAALTALALLFIMMTKLNWLRNHPPDAGLREQFELEVLPKLSVANVRLMLRAALGLPELTPQAARRLVVRHLAGRAKSTRSRRRAEHRNRSP